MLVILVTLAIVGFLAKDALKAYLGLGVTPPRRMPPLRGARSRAGSDRHGSLRSRVGATEQWDGARSRTRRRGHGQAAGG
jgi:hypothetical protein